jgi:Tol biopolymer transport system component
MDLTRAADTKRLTIDPAPDHDPAWSPDGTQLVFNSSRGGSYRLFWRAADGSRNDEIFADLPAGSTTPAWSPDGKVVTFTAEGGLWIRSVEPGSKSVRFGNAGEGEAEPAFSPDGHWVVYTSSRTGRAEIYVRPFPSGDRDYKVSVDGGDHARWRSMGEIFFLSLDGRMMAARVTAGKTFESGIPQQLFTTGQPGLLSNGRPFDVTKDGQRFIFPVRLNRDHDPHITVLTNWTARLPK